MKDLVLKILFILVLLLLLFNWYQCDRKPIPEKEYVEIDVKSKRDIDTIRDTVFIPKYIYIENSNGEEFDMSKLILDSISGDSIIEEYKMTNFNGLIVDKKDTIEYNLNTYSKSKIDSIDLELHLKSIITKDIVTIKDSIWINKTISKIHLREFNNSIGLEYMYNGNNYVIGEYTRYHKMFGFKVGGGIDINEKTPIIKTGVSVRF